jgi:hypothetical protein
MSKRMKTSRKRFGNGVSVFVFGFHVSSYFSELAPLTVVLPCMLVIVLCFGEHIQLGDNCAGRRDIYGKYYGQKLV